MKLKPVMNWARENLGIVICTALILFILPASFVLSDGWLKAILTKQEQAVNNELNKLNAAKVTYKMPQFDPTVPAFEKSTVPNTRVTAQLKEKRDAMAQMVSRIADQAEDFNRGAGPAAAGVGRSEHRVLVEDLFPTPRLTPEQAANPAAAREVEQGRLNEAEDRFLGKRGNADPYQRLLDSVRAGEPKSAPEIADQLRDLYQKRLNSVAANPQTPTEEEKTKVRQEVIDARLGEYQSRARTLGVYASRSCFPGVFADGESRPAAERGESTIPVGLIDPTLLTRRQLFLYQWDLWMLSDFFTAVCLANTIDGAQVGVDRAVVKRIESIRIRQPEGMKTGEFSEGAQDVSGAESPPVAPAPGMVPLDARVSFTGHARGGWNELFEVRRMTAKLVVSSARLNEFLDAIPRVNYMIVTDLDLEPVNTWDDLRAGYFYGDEHVVRATVEIESIWLKSWIVPLVPPELKQVLGMAAPAPSDSSAVQTQ